MWVQRIFFPEISLSKWKVSITSRGGGLCAVFLGGIDQFKNLCEGEDLKFVFKFKLMIPKIGGHALAEGFRLSFPAPRRVKIFFQVCPYWPLPGPGASLGMTWSVSSQLGHLKAILVLWGPLQISMNINLSISELHFVLQIYQTPDIAQKWFCIQKGVFRLNTKSTIQWRPL